MITKEQLSQLAGATVQDESGDKVGNVDQIYLDDDTGVPSWVTVTTGWFGSSQSFIPLEGARLDGDEVRVAHSKDKIKDAPRVDQDGDGHIERSQEDKLYSYYGLTSAAAGTRDDRSGTRTGVDTGRSTGGRGERASSDTGTGTSDGEVEMTLSEERLDVGTQTREAGRARLRKYTTTETEEVSVPVTKEKLVVEREAASPTDAAEGEITEADTTEEITLREEQPVVQKKTVPVENVRVGTEEVVEEHTVSEDVRREQVDLDTDDGVTGTEPRR